MKNFLRQFKYEFLNVVRSRWIFFYVLIVFGLSAMFGYLSGDMSKTLVTLSSVVVVLIPLVSVLFSTFYWYNSDRYTELLLTQPVSRPSVLLSRGLAVVLALGFSFVFGAGFYFLIRGYWSSSLMLVLLIGFYLTFVFSVIGIWIGIAVLDRMRGVGLAFGMWLYFAIIHDSLILLSLLLFDEYPMDTPAAFMGVLNPIGLGRVILLMQQDSALLLGHSGALMRQVLTSASGTVYALLFAAIWLILPTFAAIHKFKSRDL
ncbi:MAG: hypothetical protein ABL927_04585 [Bdellovibrionales bacterium]